jgi:hypothetical protein
MVQQHRLPANINSNPTFGKDPSFGHPEFQQLVPQNLIHIILYLFFPLVYSDDKIWLDSGWEKRRSPARSVLPANRCRDDVLM